ncbi:hypothetical protein [Microbacterium allomyrinae]|uniref:Uncharacterized protein n=1 Tax=Microbacterium allomyrinae TaxID=2830666 RepID=A0A9X1LUK9_9MICO|nr:hypothetical protein [Microbacterium allomyrinae]MCC2031943.1 hypothetical protein [Microbacterium allomyrinae]
MARQSTVTTHPQVARINEMLADGVPYSEIARHMGLSLASVGRYALLVKSELAKFVDDEPSAYVVITRLLEAADHAQEARRRSRVSGSPIHQARAIKAETDVLARLVDELGITDTSATEVYQASHELVQVLAEYARDEPQYARALIDRLKKHDNLTDLAAALSRQNRNQS